MRILFIATKSPWPAVDGGRLLVKTTLEELVALGHLVTLVAPAAASPGTGSDLPPGPDPAPEGLTVLLVAARPRPLLTSFVLSVLRGGALTLERHSLVAVRSAVARLLEEERFDAVHAEQLQALAQAEPAFARGVPVVLRAQNVESDLWAGTAAARGGLGLFAAREARRLARAEGAAVARASAAVALTAEDAARLGELAVRSDPAAPSAVRRVEVIRVPFPASASAASARLEGRPPVVLLGSGGWLPNRDSARWFLSSIWPAVRAALPGALLHVFGPHRGKVLPGERRHPPPRDSRQVFAPGAVLVVPLRIGSGVRMKILEAWARGVPVVATPQAAQGLDAEDGRELLIARHAEEFVDALCRLAEDAELGARLQAAGRAHLVERHDPKKVTRELVRVYEAAHASR